jgi:hypothetical protein
MTTGAFPLTGVSGLPHVTVINGPRARHYSNRKASGAIVPGTAVVPVYDAAGSAHVNTPGDALKMRTAVAGDSAKAKQLAIALKTVQVPDQNVGPSSLGPNEIMNANIADGEYVHAYYEGDFALTLVVPDTYQPGDLIGWDADGVRPTGISGTGAWAKDAAADIDSIFEVMEWRPVNAARTEGILYVRKLDAG